jgi:hypothetical protein
MELMATHPSVHSVIPNPKIDQTQHAGRRILQLVLLAGKSRPGKIYPKFPQEFFFVFCGFGFCAFD